MPRLEDNKLQVDWGKRVMRACFAKLTRQDRDRCPAVSARPV